MSAVVTFKAQDATTPILRILGREMKAPVKLHRRIGYAMENLTREWIRVLARTRHATARRLGARQTKFLANAGERIRVTANAAGATLTVEHPFFASAQKDVPIRPIRSKYLTIPVHAWGYGRSAREVEAGGRELFVLKTDNGAFLAHKADNNRLVIVYQLLRGVVQKKDRTRLPSKRDFKDVAEATARDMIREQLAAVAKKGKGGKR